MSAASEKPEVDMITVDGDTYFEIKLDDPNGEGFLVERIPSEEASDPEEMQMLIQDAKKELIARKEEAEDSEDNWRGEFSDLEV